MALGLEMKNYVHVLGGASIVVALQLWWRCNYSENGSLLLTAVLWIGSIVETSNFIQK